MKSVPHSTPWTAEDEKLVQKLDRRLREVWQPFGIEKNPGRKRQEREEFFQKKFEQELERCSAVSFDIFDTALIRTCLIPQHVFFFLKEKPAFASLPLSIEQIFIRRIRAEWAARDRCWQQYQSVEARLVDIYAEFCQNAEIDKTQADSLVQAEQEIEDTLCLCNPPIFQLWQKAKEKDKKILFISDTYFDRLFLCQLLSSAGYKVQESEIFPSCEHRCGKYEGKLFEKACQAVSIRPQQLLHIGDDERSDMKGAVLVKAKGLLHPYALCHARQPRAGSLENQKKEALLEGIAQAGVRGHSEGEDFWFRFGHMTMGPLLVGFTKWLVDAFQSDGVGRVYFMLRDGLILSQLYEIFRARQPDLPPAMLLPSSRRAFGMAALGCQASHEMDFLVISANPRPAREFLSRLDINIESFAHVFRQAGFSSPDEVVHHQDKADQVWALLRHPDVLAALSQRSLVERKLLIRYLEQEGVLSEEKTALVDIGWNASNQKFLMTVLAHEKKPLEATGYYLGTFSRAQDAEVPRYHYGSYLCHNGDPQQLAETIGSCRELFEVICTNFEGSLRHLTKAEGKVRPVFDPLEISSAQREMIRRVHRGILAYAQAFVNHPLSSSIDSIPPSVAAANVVRLIENPSPAEAEKIGALEHGDGVGSLTQKPLAKFSHSSLNPQKLLQDFTHSYWLKGLAAGDSSQARFLRYLQIDLNGHC